MKSKKKSFYFEDYNESEIYENYTNSNIVKVLLNRVTFLSFIFFSLMMVCSIKIIYLAFSSEKFFYISNEEKSFSNEMCYNLTWGNNYAPRPIIDLIFLYKNSIILHVDISKLKVNPEVFPLKIVIDLTGE